MTQADAIAALRNEVKILKKKVSEYEQAPRTCDSRGDVDNRSPDPRYLALEAIASALATTCPAACEEIVDQIRTGTDLAVVATSALAELTPPASVVSNNYPWSGSNGRTMVGGAVLLDGRLETPSPGLQGQPSDWMTLAESGVMETEFGLHLSIPGLPRHWESFAPFFIDKFINDFAPPNPWRHRSTTSQLDTSWLRTLAHNISSFPFSKCSLRCVATAYCGKITGIPEISLSAQNMYAASLRILQCSLAAGAESSTDSICNALTLWLFEVC
ncbi:hypothetical protein VTN77DRAFT_3540 [Rasamsonia byssochlamydoides]|uniref:uncharacterized protein n=1 Tax=Rasamsonia byssochlamydoides TaxID=89139 RepID=UPI003743C27D